jgi:hypothetical protein
VVEVVQIESTNSSVCGIAAAVEVAQRPAQQPLET